MIPGSKLELTEVQLKKLTEELYEKLDEDLVDHQAIEELEYENRILYAGKPESDVKDFPWKGAANLVVPIIGITVDSVLARIINTVDAPKPFWTVRPLTKDFIGSAKDCEDLLEWSRNVEFPWYKELKSNALETVQDGWSWFKVGWFAGEHRWYDGHKYQTIMIRRPMPQWISIRDIIAQAGMSNPLAGEWITHRTRITDTTFINRMLDGYYQVSKKDAGRILDQKESIQSPDDERHVVSNSNLNTLYEVWKHWRPSRFERPISTCLTFHRPTKTLVRAIHNPFYYGDWPFVKTTFVESKGCAGLGLAQMLKMMQQELSTLHCQQVDNATLANTRFFVGRRNAVRKDTRIWPGRFLTINGDPSKDIQAFQLGDVYSSMRNLEMSVLAYAERRSGVSDYSLGRESSAIGDRSTATGTLAIIQEGNRRFDLNVRDYRDDLATVGKLLLQVNQQFRQREFAYYVQGPVQGEGTERVLNMPADYVANKLGVELTASTATINKQVEQAGLMQLIGILQPHLQAGQQAAMILASPEVPAEMKEFTMKQFQGISTLVQRVAHSLDQRDSDELVATLGAYNAGRELAGGAQPPVPQIAGPGAGANQLAAMLSGAAGRA